MAENMDFKLHRIKVKFNGSDGKYIIDCSQSHTVLAALKLNNTKYSKLNYPDEKIVIQLGTADKEYAVATHFPCSCIQDGESLIITCESEKVEEALDQHDKTIHSRDKYSVFYIDTEGGQNAKTKKLFRNNAVKQFKYLCVYGEKGMTVEEALRRDGRFKDLGDFTLSDNDNPDELTECTQNTEILGGKKFKICLPRKRKSKTNQANRKTKQNAASDVAQQSSDATSKVVPRGGREARTDVQHSDGNAATVGQQSGSDVSASGSDVSAVGQQSGGDVSAVGQQSGSDVSAVGQQSGCSVNNRVRCRFPKLIEWMERHFPGETYQQALELRRKDFGKIQSSFSEVHTIRKLLHRSESVCRLLVEFCSASTQGTGFVLFDNFILTNAHLFAHLFDKHTLQDYKVRAQFDYETNTESNSNMFNVKRIVEYEFKDLDYAILELDIEGQNRKVPPGLLNMSCPMPQDGKACIIGHPAGEVKKMDPTCIIQIENRKQAVDDHLRQYKDDPFTVHVLRNKIKFKGIENIMMGGNRENVVTYNTFMYHGSSGSPVFDAHGRVFGLHTAGFAYNLHSQKHSVIEFAQPLLTIFEHFVNKLKESGNEVLLKRVEKEANSNQYLKKILNPNATYTAEPADPDESTDSDESMDTA